MTTKHRSPPVDRSSGPAARTAEARPRRDTRGDAKSSIRLIWRAFGRRLPELRDDLNCYVGAQTDRVRLAGSQWATRVATAVVHTVVGLTVLATGAVLVILGVAGGIATALDGKVWLANIITGAATLLVLTAVTAVRAEFLRKGRLRLLKQRYEPHATMPDPGAEGAVANGDGKSEERC